MTPSPQSERNVKPKTAETSSDDDSGNEES